MSDSGALASGSVRSSRPASIEVCNIWKSFAAPVLAGVTIPFYPGEIHALMGVNGAGKSTLMRILAGVLPPDRGEVRIGGQAVRLRTPADALAEGVAMVYQELDLALHLTVAENILLGAEPAGPLGLLHAAGQQQRVQAILAECGLDLDPRRPMRQLRTGERQLVAIAKAYARARTVLILDEPTSALNAGEVERLFQVLRRLRQQGLAIIYISHRLEEIRELCDRVTVLRNGEVEFSQAGKISPEIIVRAMIGKEGVAFSGPRGTMVPDSSEVLLEARHATSPAFDDVSFTVRAGEVLALAGLVGDGRGALADALFGLLPLDAGEIVLKGQPVRLHGSMDAVAHGIGFIPEDRRQALCPQLTSEANVTLATVPRFSNWFRLNRRQERALSLQTLQRVHVEPRMNDRLLRKLSGGTQQKVLFGRWLAADSRVLILNEPTRGVDVSSRLDIYRQLEEWLAEGGAIVLISSDLDEILHLAHRVLVMHRGRLVRELKGAEVTRESILLASSPESAGGHEFSC